MTTLKTPPPDALEYLQAVRATLADLPPEERDELMVDVETALFEAAEESERPLAARLGPPEEFAADLRAAAGLQDRQVPAPAASRLRDLFAVALTHPRVGSARRMGGELAPIWWMLRAFIAFAAVALMLGAPTSVKNPWMPVLGDRTSTLAFLALIAAGSVWLGLRHRRSRAMVRVNVALALVALPLGLVLLDKGSDIYGGGSVLYNDPPPTGLNVDGYPLRNIYAYTRDGRPLHDVALFGDHGMPLNIGGEQSPDPHRRLLTTPAGGAVFNTFPILYVDPGTGRVADPDATAVPIRPPRLTSPVPLRPQKRP